MFKIVSNKTILMVTEVQGWVVSLSYYWYFLDTKQFREFLMWNQKLNIGLVYEHRS